MECRGEQRCWVAGMTLEKIVKVKKGYIEVFNLSSDIVIVHPRVHHPPYGLTQF